MAAKKRGFIARHPIASAYGIGYGGLAIAGGAMHVNENKGRYVANAKSGVASRANQASSSYKRSHPVVGRGGVGMKRTTPSHTSTSTHSVKFHKTARHIHQASTTPSFSNHGFTSQTHTTHSISAPVAIGGAAAVAGAAGGAYYWRKRKNGQRSRVKKGVRK